MLPSSALWDLESPQAPSKVCKKESMTSFIFCGQHQNLISWITSLSLEVLKSLQMKSQMLLVLFFTIPYSLFFWCLLSNMFPCLQALWKPSSKEVFILSRRMLTIARGVSVRLNATFLPISIPASHLILLDLWESLNITRTCWQCLGSCWSFNNLWFW